MNVERAQRSLLFGSLAYRLGLLDRSAFVRVVVDGVREGSPPVEDAVRAAGAVNDAIHRRFVETARELLAAHDGDLSSALADVPPDPGTRAALDALAEPSIQAALAVLDAGRSGETRTATGPSTPPTSWDDTTMIEPEATIAESLPPTGVPTKAPAFPPDVESDATMAVPVPPFPAPIRDTVRPGERTIEQFAATPAASADPDATIATVGSLPPRVDLDSTLGTDDPDATYASVSTLKSNQPKTLSGSTSFDRETALRENNRSAQSRYRVVRSHARGGLGEVFVALDGELNREVALKEIQGRYADDAVSRARFVVEAEVTGGLEHPGIVPVYGLGEYQDGRPYYAMRFVRGESLKEAITHFHRKRGEEPADASSRELELHKLLGRFVDVCNAMEYAHVRGVLHRDLKPANVMLGPFGETLVVDWGLAKPFDDQVRTNGHSVDAPTTAPGLDRAEALGLSADLGPGTGRIRPLSASGEMYDVLFGTTVGTPHYMSPEQADGRVELTPASDIYSLGATLYNLLTGTTPFTEKSLMPLLAKVRKGDFPSPRQVDPSVPPALDAICRHAMALKPEDRYPSSRDLAEDVEHWMADEPVSAYAEPWTARAARWARRHRTFVTTAAALLIAAVVGLGTTAYLVEQERERTEANFLLARSAVDEMLTRLGAVDLVDIPGAEGVRRAMLEKARDFYLVFLKGQNGHRPSVRQGAGQALVSVGEIEEMLGAYHEADASLKQAVAMLRPLALGSGADTLDYRRDLARARHDQGVLSTRLARYTEAETALREAVDLRKSIINTPNTTEHDRVAAKESLNRLGVLLGRRPGGNAKARDYLNAAISQTEADLKHSAESSQPKSPEALRDLARFRNNLANLIYWSDPPRAAALYSESRDAMKALRKEAPTVTSYGYGLARSLSNLASLDVERANDSHTAAEERSRELASALSEYTEAIALLGTLAHDYPKVPEYRFEWAEIRLNRARLYQDGPALTRPLADFVQKDLDSARENLKILVHDYPERPDYRLRAADARVRLGLLARRKAVLTDNATSPKTGAERLESPDQVQRENTEALAELHGAVADVRATAKAFPEYADAIDYRLTLTQSIRWLAVVLRHVNTAESGKAELARIEPELKEAISLGESVLRDDPTKHDAAGAVTDCLVVLYHIQFNAGRDEDALATAATLGSKLQNEPNPSPTALVTAARLIARALGHASKSALTAKYAPLAIALLKDAIHHGFQNATDLDAKDFDVLRADPEFEKLQRAAKASKPASG
jgi:eukaryotic-like serine/threonine-protein kinase